MRRSLDRQPAHASIGGKRDRSSLGTLKRGGKRRFTSVTFVAVAAVAIALLQFLWVLGNPTPHVDVNAARDAVVSSSLVSPVSSLRSPQNATKPWHLSQHSLDESVGRTTSPPRVFIGIKTGEGLTGLRFTQVRKTWLQDALEEAGRGTLDIKFFTRGVDFDEWSSFSDPAGGGSGVDVAALRSMFVPTNCALKKDLLCATSALFRYYLEQHGNGTYFCSFDDDQYVLVRNLFRALDEYDSDGKHRGRNLYLGRQAVRGGAPVPQIEGTLQWLTGGAGYCLSRDVVERGRRQFTDLTAAWRGAGRTVGYSDDCAVAYVVTRTLGLTLVEDGRFHSHLERRLRAEMKKDEIGRQISFGYDTKRVNHPLEKKRRTVNQTMPNIPVPFSWGEDPMLFRSLRCFLIREESGRSPPECN
mmetsp:Transcript_13916/g.40714  ORF Transcript_13916/g.40714 Transcript_13916/m.40714 type:complete len:414 (-) Transcript_13916:701-1942(-)